MTELEKKTYDKICEMLDRDKQIDEMSKALCNTETCEIKKIGLSCNHRCKAHTYATRAINKGYRKSTDVAREMCGFLRDDLSGFVDKDYLERLIEIYEKKYREVSNERKTT